MSVIQTPEWAKDAVFYQIFPDRFASSAALPKPLHLESWQAPPTRHGFKGGDLLGIVERLDYLQDLGINAVYLNPIFQSAANHRYQAHDYYQVDSILGGNQALRQLLDAAHRRGMKVVLDGVFNHCGRGLYQFHHILENGASSPYIDWFSVKGFPLYAYYMPTTNVKNPTTNAGGACAPFPSSTPRRQRSGSSCGAWPGTGLSGASTVGG
jgi:cyclomaltodextrinase / maltogenic alpha-amylase / neopullulanase